MRPAVCLIPPSHHSSTEAVRRVRKQLIQLNSAKTHHLLLFIPPPSDDSPGIINPFCINTTRSHTSPRSDDSWVKSRIDLRIIWCSFPSWGAESFDVTRSFSVPTLSGGGGCRTTEHKFSCRRGTRWRQIFFSHAEVEISQQQLDGLLWNVMHTFTSSSGTQL